MSNLDAAIHYLKLCANEEPQEKINEYLQTFDDKEKATILYTAKRIMVEIRAKNGENMSQKCYDCIYRGTVPGDAHSCCNNRLAVAKGDPHGIANGWFFFPLNFDPVWLICCDGFEAISSEK